MTVAEKYYAFLDESWPTNVTFIAELARVFPADFVESTWREFSAQRSFTRSMATADLTIVDGGMSRVDFRAREVAVDDLDEDIAREAMVAHGTEKVVHCRYWTVPGLNRSRIALIAHHAIADGRGGIAELQNFVRYLGGSVVQPQQHLSTPRVAVRDKYPWQGDRKELLALLRALGDRNRELGPPEPVPWPAVTLERRPRFAPLVQDVGTAPRLADAAGRGGARMFPAMAAAAMVSAVRRVVDRGEGTLQLNVSVDLASEHAHVDRPPAMNVGVVSQRQHVQVAEPWQLARDVTSALRTSLKRGEGELFFHLSRVEKVQDLAAGTALVASAIEAAAPAVSVTHIGTIDAADDPEWLTTIWANQAPTPNQIIQAVSLEYRGRLVHSIATDDLRVPASVAGALLDDYGQLIATMPGSV
jgi:hypothetical protein